MENLSAKPALARTTLACTAIGMLSLLSALAAPSNGPTNALSPQEKASGWILLFDGKTLDGWVSRGGGAEWRVADGAIMTDSRKGGGLYTKQEFGDFVLKAEFRTTDDVDAGMYLRMAAPQPLSVEQAADPKAKKTAARRGYELQIRDTNRKGGYNTGSIIDAVQASMTHIKSNEWNTYEVTGRKWPTATTPNSQKGPSACNGRTPKECPKSWWGSVVRPSSWLAIRGKG